MDKNKLNGIIDQHIKWLKRDGGARADLCGADLTCADLRGADLDGANLRRVDMGGANLRGTVLDSAASCPAITDRAIEDAGLRVVGDYVWGYRTARSTYCGNTCYLPGCEYVAPVFSVDNETGCHPGLYLTGLQWLYKQNYCSLVRVYCRRDGLMHAGDKWRCRRLWVYDRYEGSQP